jgi:hypothetical protein
MIPRIATIILLVEDVNQQNLLRRYLQRLGHSNRNIRVIPIPNGRGSGEQHVREMYASEVRELRARLARTRSCLVAMIDADTGPTQARRLQLERALRDAEESPVEDGEPIVNLVAKRNVETWVLCLTGEAVDEEPDYRHHPGVTPASITRAALTLYQWTRQHATVPAACVPSLRESLPEFHRISL